MAAERAFLGYASTAAQAANTSTGIRVSLGKGDYAVQKLADVKPMPTAAAPQSKPKTSATFKFKKRANR
jgi:hypothetical protein